MSSLSYLGAIAYIGWAGLPAMVINGTWNKRCGPGGSTRHLHQNYSGWPDSDFAASPLRHRDASGLLGDETASTRVVKTCLLPGIVPPLSGYNLNANDNNVAFAVAA